MRPLIQKARYNDTNTFFAQHILLDLRILREILGKNNEDIRLIVHMFIKNLKDISEGLQGIVKLVLHMYHTRITHVLYSYYI